mgnify:CR=1 FL=1
MSLRFREVVLPLLYEAEVDQGRDIPGREFESTSKCTFRRCEVAALESRHSAFRQFVRFFRTSRWIG